MKISLDREKIERLALNKGMGLKDLSDLSGLRLGTLYDAFNGKHNPRISTVNKIANALGCKNSDIVK